MGLTISIVGFSLAIAAIILDRIAGMKATRVLKDGLAGDPPDDVYTAHELESYKKKYPKEFEGCTRRSQFFARWMNRFRLVMSALISGAALVMCLYSITLGEADESVQKWVFATGGLLFGHWISRTK